MRIHSYFNPRARAGRDASFSQRSITSSDFNPRARAGRDVIWAVASKTFATISIHAPARGATQLFRLQIVRCTHFNPRARAGRDVLSMFAYQF